MGRYSKGGRTLVLVLVVCADMINKVSTICFCSILASRNQMYTIPRSKGNANDKLVSALDSS